MFIIGEFNNPNPDVDWTGVLGAGNPVIVLGQDPYIVGRVLAMQAQKSEMTPNMAFYTRSLWGSLYKTI